MMIERSEKSFESEKEPAKNTESEMKVMQGDKPKFLIFSIRQSDASGVGFI